MTDLRALLRDAPEPPASLDVAAVMARGDRRRRRQQFMTTGAAVGGVVTLVLGLVGVSNLGGDSSGEPLAVVAGVGDAARDAGSARIKMVMETVVDEEVSRAEITGLVDFATRRGVLTATVDGRDTQVIGDGTTTFVAVPEAERLRTEGRPWLSYPTPQTSHGIVDLGNPAVLLDELRRTQDVEVVGERAVNDYETTHYRAALTDGSASAQFASRVDVWITRDGLPTRIVIEYVFGSAEVNLIVDLTDYGIAVPETNIPPVSEVFTGTEEISASWLQPQLFSDEQLSATAGGLACALVPQLAEVLSKHAQAFTEEQLIILEQSLANLDAMVSGLDDSTADEAREKAAVLASASMLRSLATAARTGDPVDPAVIRPVVDRLRGACPG